MAGKTGPAAAIGSGMLLFYGALKGISPVAALGQIIRGTSPGKTAPTEQISGSAENSSGTTSSAGNPGAVNGCTSAQTAANRATGRLMATAYGWGAGTQWAALDRMIGTQESGWCNTAQNPGSTAYGIGQFLDTTWASTGYTKSSDPVTQIAAMLAYIKQRYGNPVAAEQFHLANNWY